LAGLEAKSAQDTLQGRQIGRHERTGLVNPEIAVHRLQAAKNVQIG
jgi:2-methylisocitrate lyase-like PEP mutase family enzyme